MTLCLTSPSGPAGAIVELQTPSGVVKSPVVNVTSGTAIAPGSYVGEPVRWTGVVYAPSTGPLVFDAIDSRPETDFQINGDANLLLVTRTDASLEATNGNATVTGIIATLRDSTGQSTARLTDIEARLEGASVVVNALAGGSVTVTGDVSVALEATSVIASDVTEAAVMSLDAGTAQLAWGPDTTFRADAAGAVMRATAIGFFAASPVAQPTITGVTTQDQVDSLVAALVALGLVVDGR